MLLGLPEDSDSISLGFEEEEEVPFGLEEAELEDPPEDSTELSEELGEWDVELSAVWEDEVKCETALLGSVLFEALPKYGVRNGSADSTGETVEIPSDTSDISEGAPFDAEISNR